MPSRSPLEFITPEGNRIHGWYVSHEAPRMVLHILHGMMEHSARYREFADWMAGNGVSVFAADLPGHGISVLSVDALGHLDDLSGWDEVMEAVRIQQDTLRRVHPGVPVFLLGHSFGSVVARSFAQRYGRDYPLAGLILSGSMQPPTPLLYAGMAITAIQKFRYGQRLRSRLMISLGHGQYAKFFAPARTRFDWLSSVPEAVDAYLADPLCGYACTLGYYRNFFRALLDTWKEKSIREMTSHLPVLIYGGSLDPAIRFGKDIRMLAERYRKCGMTDVKMKIFKNGRHEMHQEANREEVLEMVWDWMAMQLDKQRR